MEAINIMRHESVFDPSAYPYPVHVIGAGATGSRVFASLVELGVPQINVYDSDSIEDHNLANQIYMADDVGHAKVEGCLKHYKNKLGVSTVPPGIKFHNRRVTESFIQNGYLAGGIVFIMTDTMASRRSIFNAIRKRCLDSTGNPNNRTGGVAMTTSNLLVIETRMGSTHGSVFTVNPFNAVSSNQWLSTLVDDEDLDSIELSPCGTTLSVGTTASLIANYAVWQMMQFFVDPVGLQPRIDLFFKPTLTITSPAIAA